MALPTKSAARVRNDQLRLVAFATVMTLLLHGTVASKAPVLPDGPLPPPSMTPVSAPVVVERVAPR